MNLNNQQTLAIEHTTGPLLILAGAGSGKTRVLTERIVHLIKTRACLPHELLAVTFTNKAAGEMKRRVETQIGANARDILISTFHSACVRILRRHGEKIGVNPHFVIFDDADQISLAKKVLAELNINEKILSPRSAVEKISRAKDNCVAPEDFPDGDFYHEKIARTYRLYQKELQKNGAVDFGDLLMLAVKLFNSSPETLAHYQNQFKYIMVDEYQDTNHVQYELIRLLADRHKNICVVGDPDQSVYAWRGADISNILEFEKDFPGAKIIKLEQNYRSTKNILAASDEVIANNKSRKPKTLWTENEEGDLINIIETPDERKEAVRVVKEIKRLTDNGISLKDIAIFYRTNAQSRAFEDEMRREGIPYIIYGGTRFYDRTEIKNSIAYLRLINNPHDNLSLKRIINVPVRGIGKTTFEKLEVYAKTAGVSIYDFLCNCPAGADFNSGTRKRLANFAALIKDLSTLSALPLPDLVIEAIDKTKYIEFFKAESTDEALERIANIDELISAVAEGYRQDPKMTLADFLDQVALVSGIDNYNEEGNALPLMTLHLAKGLEFSHVFIVGLEEGVLPHARSIDDPDELEEERRLFYVGMTRAKKTLCVCHANERMVRGSYNYNVQSRFLEEIPAKYVKAVTIHKEIHDKYFVQPSERGRRASTDYSDFSQLVPQSLDVGFSQIEGLFKVGQRVLHPTFGEGIVCKTEGTSTSQKLIVQFRGGELKKLSASHANLSLI